MCARKINIENTGNHLAIIICVMFGTVSCLTQVNKYEFDEATGLWLKFHEIPAIFTDAFLRCKAEGAMLASPTNETLARGMISLMSKKNLCLGCAIYTGLNALFSKGDYFSAEGIPLAAIGVTWAAGLPDNFQNSEDCLIMLPNGKLDDKKCSDTYPFICYKSVEKDLENTVCGTNDQAYSLDARTGSCYKFHNVGKNWPGAHMTCAAEGAYLAIPNSVTEANILKEIFMKFPDSNIFSSAKAVIALGFHDQIQNKMWLTIKGQTLEEAGYADFDNNQPDNDKSLDGGSHCGAMFRNGRLDDIWCYSVTVPFICEKDPSYIYV